MKRPTPPLAILSARSHTNHRHLALVREVREARESYENQPAASVRFDPECDKPLPRVLRLALAAPPSLSMWITYLLLALLAGVIGYGWRM